MPIKTLSYHTNSAALFAPIRHWPFACWLDSGKPNSHSGRYDILTAAPRQRWVTHDETTQIFKREDDQPPHMQTEVLIECSSRDPFSLLQEAELSFVELDQDIPFNGGLIGYLGYELTHTTYDLSKTKPDIHLPDMAVGLYEWAIIQDHQSEQSCLIYTDTCSEQTVQIILDTLASSLDRDSGDFQLNTLQANTSYSDYQQQAKRIIDYIYAGDCYQTNLAQCFSGTYLGDPFTAYLELRDTMASPFSAFLALENNQAILSLSPERFINIENDHIITQPIKGTAPRGQSPEQDKHLAQELISSSKNQAENLMIVDLLRNDLGKNCIPGSIEVPELFALKSYPNVHHLVSTVTGRMRSHKNALDIVRDCFPGGSITGAPKKRAMEIIDEVETLPRSIYCGSIFYLSNNGRLDSNITIRTIACDGEQLYCWGGGGIVADSDSDEEYQESITKIQAILDTLEKFFRS